MLLSSKLFGISWRNIEAVVDLASVVACNVVFILEVLRLFYFLMLEDSLILVVMPSLYKSSSDARIQRRLVYKKKAESRCFINTVLLHIIPKSLVVYELGIVHMYVPTT